MALDQAVKAEIIATHGRAADDTGSPEVQIAILSKEIAELTEHLKVHKHDFHSQRGLMKKVGQRKRMMRYLQRRDPLGYAKLIRNLGIRG